jgi:ribonuclease VapC
MIVDSSAIVAILGNEAEGDSMEQAIIAAPSRSLSAATYVETGIVVDSRSNPTLSRGFDEFLELMGIRIEPVSVKQARIARDAYRDYGQGRHRAGLNFGDCFAYALAKEKGEPLLFKGDDFRKTDVEVSEY